MTALLGSAMPSSHVDGWLAVLADVFLKGSIILLSASLLIATMRRSSAASRHLVWSLSIGSLLVLPLFSVFSPLWRIPILPITALSVPSRSENATSHFVSRSEAPILFAESETKGERGREGEEEVRPSRPTTSPGVGLPITGVTRQAAPKTHEQRGLDGRKAIALRRAIPWPFCALTVWFAGFVFILGRLLTGLASVWRLARQAKGISGSSPELPLSTLVAELGLACRARLLQSEKAIIPMTWGILHHVVLLPADVDRWPPDRLRAILLHELSHIRRRDCLTHVLARLVCAVYWLNPLVWFSVHQLRIECERACDDCVLRAGSKPSDYADHLLNLVRYLCTVKCSSPVAVPMVRLTGIERRLRAVLAADRNRNSVRQIFVAISLVGTACIIAPLGATRLVGETDQAALGAPPKGSGLPVLPADWRSNEPAVPVLLLDTFEEVLAPEALPGGVLQPFVMYDPDAPEAAERGPYRMWFMAFYPFYNDGDHWIGHVWSEDGRHFRHRQVVHTGDKRGDVLMSSKWQTGNPIVIKGSNGYRLYRQHYPCDQTRHSCRVGCLEFLWNSQDGVNYEGVKWHAMEPLYAYGGWDYHQVDPGSLLEEEGQYVLYYTASGDCGAESGKPNRGTTIGRAVSSDGVTWPNAEGAERQQVFGKGAEEQWDCEVREPSVIRRGNGPDAFWMFFTGTNGQRYKEIRTTVGFAFSHDGVTWYGRLPLFDTADLEEAAGFGVHQIRSPRYFCDPESGVEYLYFSYEVRMEEHSVYRIGRVVIEARHVPEETVADNRRGLIPR